MLCASVGEWGISTGESEALLRSKCFEIGDRVRHLKTGATGTVAAIEIDTFGVHVRVVPDADKKSANWHYLDDLIAIREADQPGLGGWRLEE